LNPVNQHIEKNTTPKDSSGVKGSFFQPKLTVNQPNDTYEQEADLMADKVMRMSLPDANNAVFFKPSANSIQRKCQHCEEEDDKKLHRKESSNGEVQSSSELDSYVSSLSSSGQGLPQSSRSFFEPRFGHDFSNVRIHTDSVAAKSAQSINALAYTTGNNIVFNSGQYSPETPSGQKLMAHELTHVVQQNTNVQSKKIQRANNGFDITGINPGGEANVIYFDQGSATIDASQLPKIAPLAAPPKKNLTLIGTSSEEGTAGGNLAIINNRINAVDTELFKAGQRGIRTHTPQAAAGEGNLNYRTVRAVEVIDTPGVVPVGGVQPAAAPPCAVSVANPNPEVTACGPTFGNAFPVGNTWIADTITKVTANDPQAVIEMNTLFPGVLHPTILDHLKNDISPQYQKLPAQHQCHNTCDGGCSRPAFNDNVGAASMMTLCSPGFLTNNNNDENAQTLVHENLHGTPNVATVDTAYATTRLIGSLTGAQALQNTDSWVLLIMRLGSKVATPVPVADKYAGVTVGAGSEEEFAKRAVAFLEQWLLTAEFDSSLLYNAIAKNIGRGGGWDPADAWAAFGVHRLAPLFGLKDPGAAAPFLNTPRNIDKVRMAGIYDRYTSMRQAVYLKPLTVTKNDVVPDGWAPNLGNTITVTTPFFAMSDTDAVLHLMKLISISIGNIPPALVKAYADGADQLRQNRGGIGP
jgi:hypothetical protein